jgi:hypothetical protein
MPASVKTKVLDAWIRFLSGGLRHEQFTKALYDHLIQHCSFIAHYSRSGFYSHYFENGDSTALFLSQFDGRGPCLSVEYGGRFWLTGDYEDLNRAMIAEAGRFLPSLKAAALRRQQAADVSNAAALLAKHGIQLDLGGQVPQQDSPGETTGLQNPLFADGKTDL